MNDRAPTIIEWGIFTGIVITSIALASHIYNAQTVEIQTNYGSLKSNQSLYLQT